MSCSTWTELSCKPWSFFLLSYSVKIIKQIRADSKNLNLNQILKLKYTITHRLIMKTSMAPKKKIIHRFLKIRSCSLDTERCSLYSFLSSSFRGWRETAPNSPWKLFDVLMTTGKDNGVDVHRRNQYKKTKNCHSYHQLLHYKRKIYIFFTLKNTFVQTWMGFVRKKET